MQTTPRAAPAATVSPPRKTVAVIGRGISGLVAVKAFSERGHHVLGFERTHDLGGVWEPSRSYPDVQTQSPKDLYRFTDMAMPDDYPEWPKGPQVYAYIQSYAKKHDLPRLFRLNTTVDRIDRRPDGQPAGACRCATRTANGPRTWISSSAPPASSRTRTSSPIRGRTNLSPQAGR